MSTLRTTILFTLNTLTQTFTHALGTTPDHLVFENLGIADAAGIWQPIAVTATVFYVRGGADDIPCRVTCIRGHSIDG